MRRLALHIAVGAAVLAFEVYASRAGAQPVPRDMPQLERRELVSEYVRTKVCMRSAGIAAYRRSDDARMVRLFMVAVCGGPFQGLLERGGTPQDRARDTVDRMARTSYYEDVLGVPEPLYDPSNPSE